MALFRGRAAVLEVKNLPTGASHKFSEDFRLSASPATDNHSIRTPFAPPQAKLDEQQPPARKRRKVDKRDLHQTGVLYSDNDHSILIAKAVIDLDSSPYSRYHSAPEAFDSRDNFHDPIVVSLESFSRIEPEDFQVQLYNLETGAGVAIDANFRGNDFHDIAQVLQNAAKFSIPFRAKWKSSIGRAAFCRCSLVPTAARSSTYRLEVELRWLLNISVVVAPKVSSMQKKQDLGLLAKYFHETLPPDDAWSVSDFYNAAHVPPTDLDISPQIGKLFSNTTLYPFQQRAVDWLLRREGVAFSPSGALEESIEHISPISFKRTQDKAGRECYVSHLRGMVVPDLGLVKEDDLQSLHGGILAEEMGLGKTLELIALILLNKRSEVEDTIFDSFTETKVRPTSATLIITPDTILNQWITEIETYAPELKVLHYKGLPHPFASKWEQEAATVENLLHYDVVLTTYNVLSKEIHHAIPPPDRPTRTTKQYERRNSPLMGLSWWRVCLDEAQRIESGVSHAAQVARMIPRHHAWAVSGTPIRKGVEDLRGLLLFLRCDLFSSYMSIWERLDKNSFHEIFSRLALRHTKDQVREELQLPEQRRIVVTVPFTTIEEQNYSDIMRQMCQTCSLTPEGLPMNPRRDAVHPEVIERMRGWLVRLRQTCLHAHVGRKNRQALGGKGAVRTLQEVLEIMIYQNEIAWKAHVRECILLTLRLGHIKAYAGDDSKRASNACNLYKEAQKEAQRTVDSSRQALAAEYAKLGKTPGSDIEQTDLDMNEDEEGEDMGRIPVIRKTLRSFLELLHACHFFVATAFHQMNENKESPTLECQENVDLEGEEKIWYQNAKIVRLELLLQAKKRTLSHMSRVKSEAPFHQIPRIDDLPDLGGIESSKTLSTMDIMSVYLDEQAKQIKEWRAKIGEILLQPLIDDDEHGLDDTGEEYGKSLEDQDKLYVYIMALRTLVADRSAATHGLKDTLVEHELNVAERQARRSDVEKHKNRGHAPELVLEVAMVRRKLQALFKGGSLKGIVAGIRSLINGLQWRAESDPRAASELIIMQKHVTHAQDIFTQQSKTIVELERELELFRATMNQRLEYYRQFQHISDTVAPYKEDLDDEYDALAYNECTKLLESKRQSEKLRSNKHAYLTNLRAENQQDVEVTCPICQDGIEVGVFTRCGHTYCKECIQTWWRDKRTCPICKKKLVSSDFKDINLKPSEITAREERHEPTSMSQSPSLSNQSIYTEMTAVEMKEIKQIELDRSYGTKIDLIARTLLRIRVNDKGAKTIIFSQFNDFLGVLRDALKKWKISASCIGDNKGVTKFKTDPNIECFLLDAKADSSGLNLVNATYVFLCEPLINPAIELQAISRVHRIGQHRRTTVYMFLVRDTVEEAIYEISVARRLEHIKSSATTSNSGTAKPVIPEKALDKANSIEVQLAPLNTLMGKKGSGEQVHKDYIWKCLFGRPRKPMQPAVEEEVNRHLRAEAVEERLPTRPSRFHD